MATILMTGATGTVSSATIRALSASGQRVLGLARDPKKAERLEVEIRVGDLEKPRTLEGAFDGVDVAWLLAPPGPLAPYHMSNALFAARKAGVKHIVRMSAVGAAHDAPTLNSRLHALSDTELSLSGVPYTLLKPHFFTQNLAMFGQSARTEGTLHVPLGDAKLPMVDVRDIAVVAARVLVDPAPHAGKTYTLTGPKAIGMQEVADALGAALGRAVKYVDVPVLGFVETLAKMGVDDYGQVATRDYFTAYSRGWQSEVTPWVERLTGTAPRGIADFARDFAG
jgi:uncharacterized protein YbjT (DUF2867 family)